MGSVTSGWPSLRSLFALAISAVTSAEGVKVLVGFSGACGAGCFANAATATRVKARLIIILRIKPPSVLRPASASYASPALDTTICPRNQGEPDPTPDKQDLGMISCVATTRIYKLDALQGATTNLKKNLPREESGLGLNKARGAHGFDDRSLGLVAEGSDLFIDGAVRYELAILIQILQKRRVVILAVMYVGEQEIGFRGIGLQSKRFAD